MNVFIAFLRGINVSGQKKIKMGDLKTALEKSGLEQVTTYIQSGNMVLKSADSPNQVATKIETVIKTDFDYDVPVLITTLSQLKSILNKNPFMGEADDKNQYFVLPYDKPEKNQIPNLNAKDYPNEEFYISEDCIYLNCKIGAGKAKLSNNLLERKLKLTATTRNLRTLKKIIELAESYA